MRFAVMDQRLVPEPFARSSTNLHPVSSLEDWHTPPLNPSFSYSSDLQLLLDGKELLLEDIPLSLSLIHQHYENGYVSYEKGIEKKRSSIIVGAAEMNGKTVLPPFIVPAAIKHVRIVVRAL